MIKVTVCGILYTCSVVCLVLTFAEPSYQVPLVFTGIGSLVLGSVIDCLIEDPE